MLTTPLNIAFVQGLAATRRFVEAFARIDETMTLVETDGDLCYMPELLRVKANLVLTISQTSEGTAETCFARSIELSHSQGAHAWELRAAIGFASLLAGRGEHKRVRAILQLPFENPAEDSDTSDLLSAAPLLAALD